MKRIKKFIALVIILCVVLCGCGKSGEPVFKERYEEITDALYIACNGGLLSAELFDNTFDFENYKRGYYNPAIGNMIDASTVTINEISDVYKPSGSESYVKFCGVDMSFKLISSDEYATASFLLVLTDGKYGWGTYGVLEVPEGFTDVRTKCDGISDEVDTMNQYVSLMKGMSDNRECGSVYEVDYYASTIDMEYLNKLFSEKCASDVLSS